jgi:hypothetical protein
MEKIDTDVGKLVSMIEDGELQLPEMQRRYVWPATRVRDLLDSLYRGYPSGAILVWATDREMPSRGLAVAQKISPFKGYKLLLDGQQRLTSLTAILRGEPVTVGGRGGRKKPIEILFNLSHPDGPPLEVIEVDDDTIDADGNDGDDDGGQNLQERLNQRAFVVANSALSADPRWVSVSEVFKGTKTDAQVLRPLVSTFDDPLFDKYSRRLQALRKIRDYPYVMRVLDKSLSYEEVAEIFVRVNSLGMKLRGSDLALAQITSRWQNSLEIFEQFQEECDEKSSYTLDLGVLVRALVVFATGQSRFKTVGTTPLTELQRGWAEAKEGLQFAISFLRSNAGIENETLLSSPLFLIAVAYYGSQRRFNITPEEAAQIRRWVYVANARGHYSGSSETVLDADLNIIRKNEDLMSALELQLGRLRIEPADFVGRNQQSSLFAMAYLALKAKGAKDWRSQLELSLTHQGKEHSIEYHHIFPRKVLKNAGFERAATNEIANMAFIAGGTNRSLSAKPTAEYLAEVLDKQGKTALELHCIPVDPSLWAVEAYPQFLEFRRNALAQAINDLILNGAQAPRIGVRELISSGESESVEFKSSARWDYRAKSPNKALEIAIVKSVSGFLNGKGGVLLIGVDDAGLVIGLEPDYKTLTKRPDRDGYGQFLVTLLSAALGKDVCASISISFQSIEEKDVCCIRVQRNASPVYIEDGQHTRFYVRVGNTTQELTTKESVAYIGTHWSK